jgi:hypothetical protein
MERADVVCAVEVSGGGDSWEHADSTASEAMAPKASERIMAIPS